MRQTICLKTFNNLNNHFHLQKGTNILRNYSCTSKLFGQNKEEFLSTTVVPNNLLTRSVIFQIPAHSKLNILHSTTAKTTKDTKNETKECEKATSDTTNPEKIVVIEYSRKEKLKKAVKEYGSTVIVFHVAISLISLGSSYLVVSTGLDVSWLFETIGLKEWLSGDVATNAGTFAVAYAIHKLFAPLRITITLASVPFIVRYLRKIGFLKK